MDVGGDGRWCDRIPAFHWYWFINANLLQSGICPQGYHAMHEYVWGSKVALTISMSLWPAAREYGRSVNLCSCDALLCHTTWHYGFPNPVTYLTFREMSCLPWRIVMSSTLNIAHRCCGRNTKSSLRSCGSSESVSLLGNKNIWGSNIHGMHANQYIYILGI